MRITGILVFPARVGPIPGAVACRPRPGSGAGRLPCEVPNPFLTPRPGSPDWLPSVPSPHSGLRKVAGMTLLGERRARAGVEPLVAVRPWTIALAFGLAAAVVCAAGSWLPSLWGDEAATLLSAERPVGSLLYMLRHVDAVHGLYYLAMHGWVRLAGTSAFALRLPSAVAAGLAVAATTLIAGRRGGPRAAIVAGIVAAVLPRLTYAGEEARSFAFTAAGAAWLTLLLLWLVDGGGRRAPASVRRSCWLLYGAGMAALSYLFLYAATLLLAHAAILLIGRVPRESLRRWAAVAGGAVVLLSPLALLAYFERSQIGYLGRQPLDAGTVLSVTWFGTGWVAIAGWACILAALAPAAAAWLRSRRTRGAGLPVPLPVPLGRDVPRGLSTTLVGTCWLLLPTGFLLAVNLLVPVYTPRYSTFAAPAAALLVAEGLLVIGRRLGRARPATTIAVTGAGVLAFVAVCAPVYLLQRGPFAQNDSDWSLVSAAIGAHAQPGDAVVFDEATRPSRQPRLAMRTYPQGFAAVRDVTLEVPYDRNDGWADRAYSVRQAAALGRFDGIRRVWLLEDDIDGALDHYGLAELQTLGFEPTALRIDTHRTMIIELER